MHTLCGLRVYSPNGGQSTNPADRYRPCAGAKASPSCRSRGSTCRVAGAARVGEQMVEHRPTRPGAAPSAAVCIDFSSACASSMRRSAPIASSAPPTPRALWNMIVGSTSGVGVDGVNVAGRRDRVGELVVRGPQLDHVGRPRIVATEQQRRVTPAEPGERVPDALDRLEVESSLGTGRHR